MKKFVSVFLAAVLVLSVCITVLAEDNTFDQSFVGDPGWTVTWTDTFKKAEGDSAQNLPSATISYSIEPGSEAAATSSSPKITAGITGVDDDGNTVPSVSQAIHRATDLNDTEDSISVTVTFTGVKFPEAGIYRYNVTVGETVDSTSSDDIAIDVLNEESAGSYYLDVYVQNDGNGNYSPYAYILSEDGEISAFTKKGEGKEVYWEAAYSEKVDKIVNELTTYDLTVTKVIEGSAAQNKFPFTIEISNVPKEVYVKKNSEDAVTGSDTGSISFTGDLGNNDSIMIVGLPSSARYNITEAVNQMEGYEVTVTVNNSSEAATDVYHWIGTTPNQGTSFGSNSNPANAMGKQDNAIVFTNLLNNISPTGVVLRVAPYAIILSMGVALLLISRRRRTEKE